MRALLGHRSAGSDDFTDLIEDIARSVVAWRLSMLAIVVIETAKPLTFLGSSLLVFLKPFASVFVDTERLERLALMLQDRSNVEKLIGEIERMEEEERR